MATVLTLSDSLAERREEIIRIKIKGHFLISPP
jgi:hypothetical protein